MILLLCLVAVVGLACGCRTAGPGENDDQLPWNTPASWEGQIIGVPY